MTMPEASRLRLYLLRFLYLGNFLMLSVVAWPRLVGDKTLDPLPGVTFSFWAALALLSALGLRYPLKMLPLLFLQLTYKAVWLLTVALPLSSAGRSAELTNIFLIGLVGDIIVIPWPYVVVNYFKTPGDKWR